MEEGKDVRDPEPMAEGGADSSVSPKPRTPLTRRDFLIRANVGAVAVGVASGAAFASTLLPETVPPSKASSGRIKGAAISWRRVTLNIDGRKYDVDVDVRESLWETMNHQLGLSNSNLGCDRAQCGTCTVLVDGKPMNACTLLSARLGRGQKVVTVGGIAAGPGVDGLHAVQRAFWLEGAFQCGICTRGFIMSSYALLQTNRNPTDAQIKEALSGNICRCGEYPKIFSAVKKAAAELRGERVAYAAPIVVAAKLASAAAPAASSASRQFEFAVPLGTIEDFDEVALELKQRPGVLGVSGSERTISVTWDATKLNEAQVRQMLAEMGYAVK